MTQLSWVPRISIQKLMKVTPTVTAGAYTSGMQLGGIMTLTDCVRFDSNMGYGTATLVSIQVADKSATSPAIDVWIFDSLPTLASVDHQAFDLSDANLAKCISATSVGSAYSVSASNGMSTDGGAIMKSLQNLSGSNLYAVAVIRSGVTLASTSDITFGFGLLID